MRVRKKLLAIVLCVAILVVANAVPVNTIKAAADTTSVQHYISLLNLNRVSTESTVEKNVVALPSGIQDLGITKYAAGWQPSYNFIGSQKIVENYDGSKGWRINFDFPTTTGIQWNQIPNEFSIKIPVPAEFAPYVIGIRADITDATANTLYMNFGVSDGTNCSSYSATTTNAFDRTISGNNVEDPVSMIEEKRITELYKERVTSMNTPHTNLDTMWQEGDDITYLYLVLYDAGGAGTEGSYMVINDIGIIISMTDETGDTVIERNVQLFDFSEYPDGTFSQYPQEIYEAKENGKNQITSKRIVTKDNGKKALKIDFSTQKIGYSGGNANEIYQGGYTHVYSIRLKVPSNHVPFIDKITFKYEKQSSIPILFNFGVTDGEYFSKEGTGENVVLAPENNGAGAKHYNPANLNFVTEPQAGTAGTPDVKWGKGEFTELFLWITARPTTSTAFGDGYIIIDEISYTMTASNKDIEGMKGFVNSFEQPRDNYPETPFAISGNRAYKHETASGNNPARVAINTNTNLSEASGLSFWIYNPTTTNTTYKICLKGSGTTSYVAYDDFAVPAGSRRKVTINFSSVFNDTNPSSVTGFTKGSAVSLNPEQIAALTAVTVMCRQSSLTVYSDDYRLLFTASRGTFNIPLENTHGTALVTEENTVRFTASSNGSSLLARIPVKEGDLAEAKELTLEFDFEVPAKFSVTLLGINDEGKAAHWKWGYKEYYKVISSPGTGLTYKLPFAGNNSKYNTNTIHEGSDEGGANCNQCTPPASWDYSSGHANNPPSATERATIHTILIRVYDNIGASNKGATLKSITVSNAPNTISAAQPANGTGGIYLDRTTAYVGETVGFYVEPAEGYHVKSVEITGNNGIKYEPIKKYDGINVGNYYNFKMPAATITVSAVLEQSNETIVFDTTLPNKTDADFHFQIPLRAHKAYSPSTGSYENLASYGAVLVATSALEKYGYNAENLTLQKLLELEYSGHHLGKYIYVLDGSKAVLTSDNADSLEFTVSLKDIPIDCRRSGLTLATYATFENENAAPFFKIVSKTSVDKYYYGDRMPEQLYMRDGINLSRALQSMSTVAYTHHVFQPFTWETLREKGFDHIRLPFNVNNSIDSNGKLIEEHMQKLDRVIYLALNTG
ncbi:MAG: hypothetical protein ACOYJS_04130, partial [Acutalibacteraceae bacterium]